MPAHIVNVIEPRQPPPPPPPLRPRAKINSSAQPRARASVRIKARVPPTALRSPSPPTSTLSFSSHSSDDPRPLVPRSPDPRSLDPRPLIPRSPDPRPPDDHKANAKSNRKIADLEITNRSLLAINASLESTMHKQAREIRDLRRKLRESRLILPPPAFRAVNDADPTDDEDDDDDDDDDDGVQDEVYVRIKSMLDSLLQTGRAALHTQPREGAAKVLSPDEVRSWTEEDDPRTLVHSTTQGQYT